MRVFGGDRAPAKFVRKGTRLRAVHSVSVHFEPVTYLREMLDGWFGDHALRSGPYVEEIVSVLARNVDKLADQGLRRFPAIVVLLESPRVIGGDWGFPIVVQNLYGNFVVAGAAVIA